jgi:hypothetical protein
VNTQYKQQVTPHLAFPFVMLTWVFAAAHLVPVFVLTTVLLFPTSHCCCCLQQVVGGIITGLGGDRWMTVYIPEFGFE